MKKDKVLVVPIAQSAEAAITGAKKFVPEKVIFLAKENDGKAISRAEEELRRSGIKSKTVYLKGKNLWEETFREIGLVAKSHGNHRTVVSLGDNHEMGCAAASASYVNGLTAFALKKGEIVLLPVMKIGYEQMLAGKKMEVLREIYKKGRFPSLDSLGRTLGMSLPLISYHVNGNAKSDGLVELGLVSTEESGAKVKIGLTKLGQLLMSSWN